MKNPKIGGSKKVTRRNASTAASAGVAGMPKVVSPATTMQVVEVVTQRRRRLDRRVAVGELQRPDPGLHP